MRLNFATVSKNGQTTIPIAARRFLHLEEGDRLLFEIAEKDHFVKIKKIEPFDAEFALSLESTLSKEWGSTEDEAYDDL